MYDFGGEILEFYRESRLFAGLSDVKSDVATLIPLVLCEILLVSCDILFEIALVYAKSVRKSPILLVLSDILLILCDILLEISLVLCEIR